MLNRNNFKQNKFVVTTLETLMPEEHFLRDLDKYVDFGFIYEKVSHMYSNVGRKSVDPAVLVKMLLLGFLYGIDSERRLEKEIQVNVAYRWFLGIDLDEPVPDHSTISQTRRRKWKGTAIFEEIFTEIVQKCIDAGLVDGKLILTDSTHVKANASNKRFEVVTIEIKPREYLQKLDRLCEEEEQKHRADAMHRGLKKSGPKPSKELKTRKVLKSTTDPDCGKLSRPGKPDGFHYLNHQSVDGKSGIITDVLVTPADTDDGEFYVDRIKHQLNKYGFPISEVGMDSGYDWDEIHSEMYDLGIKTFTPLIDTNKRIRDRVYPLSAFEFDSMRNVYICPNGCILRYSYIDRNKYKKIYCASQKDCRGCPVKDKCIGGSLKCRRLMISLVREKSDCQRLNYGTKRYYEVQRKRRLFCEGNFALQKDNHNLRRTRKRGNDSVMEHCLCSALALNLKRLVRYLKHGGYTRKISLISLLLLEFCKISKVDLSFLKSTFFFPLLSTRPVFALRSLLPLIG